MTADEKAKALRILRRKRFWAITWLIAKPFLYVVVGVGVVLFSVVFQIMGEALAPPKTKLNGSGD